MFVWMSCMFWLNYCKGDSQCHPAVAGSRTDRQHYEKCWGDGRRNGRQFYNKQLLLNNQQRYDREGRDRGALRGV